jgi:hypothetical protein
MGAMCSKQRIAAADSSIPPSIKRAFKENKTKLDLAHDEAPEVRLYGGWFDPHFDIAMHGLHRCAGPTRIPYFD